MVAFPDVAHDAPAITGAMRHQDNDRKCHYPVRLKGAIALVGMIKRNTGHQPLNVFDPDPGMGVTRPQEPAPNGMGIVQQIVMEGPKVQNAVVIIVIRHFRVTKTGKIRLALPLGPLDLLRTVKGAVENLDLTPRFETG